MFAKQFKTGIRNFAGVDYSNTYAFSFRPAEPVVNDADEILSDISKLSNKLNNVDLTAHSVAIYDIYMCIKCRKFKKKI